jgi:hypothetical protein
MAEAARVQKAMKMGLGESVQRLIRVEYLLQTGLAPSDQMIAERQMILEALNTHQLSLGFDCDNDGVPDTVEIFKQAAETSCCRIMPADTSRKRKASSRRISPTPKE